jgi:DNA-directed RNA polymerase specialized sigma subunit
MDLYPNADAPYRSDFIRELVDKLPEGQCYVLSRLFFGGATVPEVAVELGISDYRVQVLRRQGIAALAKKLGVE